ncbi:MAG: sulfide/dihydroorotate dehydrogenase-like FAD/NAD-binding protein [Oscillospiraceae bacterium]|jgi:ferredoxin--NADP+ reductase|nr:sulfide/dihydroorotate dehydrogenase-like FAD/NAD-binding protein [Oscillospiraceae bacterium]
MYAIIKKEQLSEGVFRITVHAPLVAKKAKPGQFIILRVTEDGERIPLTVGGYDRERGTVSVMFQVAGATTKKLAALKEGDRLTDFVGPLGRPTEIEGIRRACVIGGGVGCAIAYPIAKALHEQGTDVTVIIGFRDTSRIILEDEFKSASTTLHILTDDGSNGNKGFVTAALGDLLTAGETYDDVIAIGPIMMMKAVAELTRPYNMKTTVSMNPIMIDGTGMCGGCRLTVGGQTKFACVDGPDFDGHLVDFDAAAKRNGMYRDSEKADYEHACRLLENTEVR